MVLHDGNGRMSRLLTLLLFYKAGYIVGKYVIRMQMVSISTHLLVGKVFGFGEIGITAWAKENKLLM